MTWTDLERSPTGIQIQDASIQSIQQHAGANLRALIIAAATGSKGGCPLQHMEKTWAKHAQRWFKSEPGGRELAQKMLTRGVWAKVNSELLPFLNAVRSAVGQQPISDLHP